MFGGAATLVERWLPNLLRVHAAIDAEALIDLGAYGVQQLADAGAVLAWSTLPLPRVCSCSSEPPRKIRDQGVVRILDSQAEPTSDPCEAVLVKAPKEAQGPGAEVAKAGPRLLSDDLQLSDLGGRECARLCNHGSKLYMLSCAGRKFYDPWSPSQNPLPKPSC